MFSFTILSNFKIYYIVPTSLTFFVTLGFSILQLQYSRYEIKRGKNFVEKNLNIVLQFVIQNLYKRILKIPE